eukprot:COSAG04_NODE_14029_length_583_cov_1.082645_1_plen_75_part_01
MGSGSGSQEGTNDSDSVPVTADAGFYVAAGAVETCTPVANAASVTCANDSDSVPVACDTGYTTDGTACTLSSGEP